MMPVQAEAWDGWGGALARRVLAACEAGGLVGGALDGAVRADERVCVIAFGKASGAMCEAACTRLGGRCVGGVALAGEAHLARVPSVLESFAVDHPLPTERNVRASRRLGEVVRTLGADTTLLALVSGGGSAHLTLPIDGLTVDDLREATDALLRAGATIGEINTVRKHAEALKGGRLARLASGAGRVVQLTVSDVIGDDLSTIASGAMVGDASTYADAMGVLDAHGLGLARLREVLDRGVRGELAESVKPGEACVARVEHVILASNSVAVESAMRALGDEGWRVERSASAREGEAADVARGIVREWRERGGAIVWGGETTVRVRDGDGRGGRVQEMMLAIAIELDRQGLRASAMGLATDGVDGATDAAGAVVDPTTCGRMRAAGVDPVSALASHDSYGALSACGAILRTGATGTNVNDVVVIREEARA